MSDREDLPFITHPIDDTPLAALAPEPAASKHKPVDMVARPTGKGTDLTREEAEKRIAAAQAAPQKK